MLPTPSTSHVNFDRIYEPAEDSYLLLDTLSSPAETLFLSTRFNKGIHNPPPIIVEIGTGSGIVLAFVATQAEAIFGRNDIVALGTDVNEYACRAAEQTVAQGCKDTNKSKYTAALTSLSSIVCADLASPLRSGMADVMIFNPPYVPSDDAPGTRPVTDSAPTSTSHADHSPGSLLHDSYLLSLSYAGGFEGMEVTNRFLEELPSVLSQERGVAYVLLCQQNNPEEIMQRIRSWGNDWCSEIVGRSGKQAGWEKLVVLRIWKMYQTRPSEITR